MAKSTSWLPGTLNLIVVFGICTPFWPLKVAAIIVLVFSLLFYLDQLTGIDRDKLALILGLALIMGFSFLPFTNENMLSTHIEVIPGLFLGMVMLLDMFLLACTPIYLAYKADWILEKRGYRKPNDFSIIKILSYANVVPAVFWFMTIGNEYFHPQFPFMRDVELLFSAISVMTFLFIALPWFWPPLPASKVNRLEA